MLTIHSGGALGSDQTFGDFGVEFGYRVIHHSFSGHSVNGAGQRNILSGESLVVADQHLVTANKSLNRSFPPRNQFVKKLLQRNYYQVINSQLIVAIAKLDSNYKSAQGGTGWAVQMSIDQNKPIYLFDDNQTNKWYKFDYNSGVFVPLTSISVAYGSFAGIGTRNITATGINEIKRFLTVYKQHHTKLAS